LDKELKTSWCPLHRYEKLNLTKPFIKTLFSHWPLSFGVMVMST